MTPQAIYDAQYGHHPKHAHTVDALGTGQLIVAVPPPRVRPVWKRWVSYWRCWRAGGHWWHVYGFVDNFCCRCGLIVDGWPDDRTAPWL